MSELITQPEKAEALLENIIERFRDLPLATHEVYSAYGLDDTEGADQERAKQKSLFIQNKVRNPTLNYPVLEKMGPVLADEEKATLDLMAESTVLDFNEDREIALWNLLRQHYLEVSMMSLSAKLTDVNLSPEERQKIAQDFSEVNDEINGELSPGLFANFVKPIHEKAVNILASDDAPLEIRAIALYLRGFSKDISNEIDPKKLDRLTDEEVESLKELLQDEFADLIACVPKKEDGEVLSMDELADMFRKAHQIRSTGWEVRIQPGQSNVDTRQSEEVTVIGADRKLPTYQEAIELLIHENGVHVESRVRGDRSGDPLLAKMGLAFALDSQEGLAKLSGKIASGKKPAQPPSQYYLLLGWARGLDGEPRDFRKVYELDWRQRVLKEYAKKGEISPEKISSLRSSAYNACVRVFRGTTCDLSGVVFSKDQSYTKGDELVVPVLKDLAKLPAGQRSEAYNRLLSTKFNFSHEGSNRLVDISLAKQGDS